MLMSRCNYWSISLIVSFGHNDFRHVLDPTRRNNGIMYYGLFESYLLPLSQNESWYTTFFYGNEFDLHDNKRACTRTRFETEAKGNSDMSEIAYYA